MSNRLTSSLAAHFSALLHFWTNNPTCCVISATLHALETPTSTCFFAHCISPFFLKNFFNMANAASSPLYLGFDLSTQQLKGIAVGSDLKVFHSALFDFDKDAKGFPNIKKGVLTNEAEREVFAPVAMWLQAIDAVLQRLHDAGIDFGRVAGISGAGQQHGSVYWSMEGSTALRSLDKDHTLEKQLGSAFSYPYSPNWQDASTQEQCDMFDQCLGDEKTLALNTGSKAHHVGGIQT